MTYEELKNEAGFYGNVEKIMYADVTNAKLKHYEKRKLCLHA